MRIDSFRFQRFLFRMVKTPDPAVHRLPVVRQDQDEHQAESQDDQGAVIVALVDLGPLEGQQQGAGNPPTVQISRNNLKGMRLRPRMKQR